MIVSAAEEMNPARRSTMEDVCVYHEADTWNCGRSDLTFLGVYDGHGGRDIVDFLEAHLSETIARELRHNDDDDASILQKLERGFLIADVMSHRAGVRTSGAAVVVCLIQTSPEGTTVHAANCGDARAVVCRTLGGGDVATNRLTHDHRASDPMEQRRIEASGGFVLRDRVLGVLAVARSLGDHGLKRFVVARPHLESFFVERRKRNDNDDDRDDHAVLIVACDGLWDVVSDEEAGATSLRAVASCGTERERDRVKRETAQTLVDEALRRGSGDNVTVLTAWLDT